MVFPVVMYGCESWTIKKADCQRIDAFELCCWIRLLRVPWTARRSNQSILKEISPGCSLEGMMLKLKLHYFGHCREPAYCILSAYWVQHFPQHHLSGSGIAQLEFYHCWEPVWGTLPLTKVMRKEARHTQRRDRASGVPLEILEHLHPKPESAYFLLCAFTYTSDFTGSCPPLPLWKNS